MRPGTTGQTGQDSARRTETRDPELRKGSGRCLPEAHWDALQRPASPLPQQKSVSDQLSPQCPHATREA